MTFSAVGQGARVFFYFYLLFLLLFIYFTQRTNPAFLFLHFLSEERAVCLSHKKRRIQPLGLKGVRDMVLENRGGRLQLDKNPRSAPWQE